MEFGINTGVPNREIFALPVGAAMLLPIVEVSGGVRGRQCIFPDDCPIEGGYCYNEMVNEGNICPPKK